ncbi:E3 ubiquitin-protein ligase MARCHF7 [Lissotriton helveticus]
MKSSPSRIPRRRSVQPSSSLPLNGSSLYGGAVTGSSDAYPMGDDSAKLESEFQSSTSSGAPRRDWVYGEMDISDSPWKRATLPEHSGSLQRPWSGNLIGNRLVPAPEPYQPAELERTHEVHSRIPTQQQDRDSKRPKLSYSGYSSLSGMQRNSSGLNAISDSSWRYSQVPRSSSILSSPDSELMGLRRAHERPTQPTSAFVDYSSRNGDLTSSAYLQEPVASSHPQGARPKQSVLGPVQLNSSTNHQLPSEHPSSLFTRDSNRSFRRQSAPREGISPQGSAHSSFTHVMNNDGFPSSSTPFPLSSTGRLSPSRQTRSVAEAPTDTDGRRTTRHILSRLASSMSSTLFSRRSSQDSLNARALNSGYSYAEPVVQGSVPSSATQSRVSNPTSTSTDVGSSESSQGFGFLRRRRWCLPTGSQNQRANLDTDRYRGEEPEARTTSSWLSSSFRNRCTPLFCRRRREGRAETPRMSTSETSRLHPLFGRSSSREVNPGEAAAQCLNRAASTGSPDLHTLFRREARAAGPSGEPTHHLNGATSVLSPVPEMPSTSTATSLASVSQRRNVSLSDVYPDSLFSFAVPPGLGSSSPNNVMITVDVFTSGRTPGDGHDNGKSQSSRDPEKLKKIKESLLMEDSEEEEGDICRICQMGASTSSNPLIEPCKCAGSLQYVHQDCMKKWLQAKINSGSRLEAVTTCELCKEKLRLDLDDFDVRELYRAHHSERADYEFLSSGLYLVVLLHLCEQRFTNLLGTTNEASTHDRFTSLARTLQAHLADLETSEDDSEADGDC